MAQKKITALSTTHSDETKTKSSRNIALIASISPAFKAAKLNPVDALRQN